MTQEEDEKCFKCGCEIGHFIDCPNGSCFTTKGLDEKEFEKLWNFTDEAEFSHYSYEYRVGKYYFLAARRSLREKKGK